MTTTFLIVRHAHVHNPRNVIYGRLPRFRLSAEGQQQAERTARYLANVKVSRIYTSPLLRARQTAQAIHRHHPEAPFHRTALLPEVLTGWQGTSMNDLKEAVNFYHPLKNPEDETPAIIFARMHKFVRRGLLWHPGETIVGVSHGDPIKILRMGMLGADIGPHSVHEPDPERGSITRLDYHGPHDNPRPVYQNFLPVETPEAAWQWHAVKELPQAPPPAKAKELTSAALAEAGDAGRLGFAHGHFLWVAQRDGELWAMDASCLGMTLSDHQLIAGESLIDCPLHDPTGQRLIVVTKPGEVVPAELAARLVAHLRECPPRRWAVRLVEDRVEVKTP